MRPVSMESQPKVEYQEPRRILTTSNSKIPSSPLEESHTYHSHQATLHTEELHQLYPLTHNQAAVVPLSEAQEARSLPRLALSRLPDSCMKSLLYEPFAITFEHALQNPTLFQDGERVDLRQTPPTILLADVQIL